MGLLGNRPKRGLDQPDEASGPLVGQHGAVSCGNDAEAAAETCWEATMAGFIAVVIIIAVVGGVMLGIFLRVSFAIRTEDRQRGSLAFDAPNSSARMARDLVGISGSRWED
jgi:hypothetical protein